MCAIGSVTPPSEAFTAVLKLRIRILIFIAAIPHNL